MKQSKSNNEVDKNDIIARYVYAVIKDLPANSRNDIEEELKTLIYDMLEERVGDREPAKKDIELVLKELGHPRELSEKYMDHKKYLIGPQYFHLYIMVLKIVVFAVVLGMTIASIVEGFTANQGNPWNYFVHWIGGLVSGISSACVWVTFIFAFIEYRGIKLDEITGDWIINELPEVPSKKASIPKGVPISGIIFTIFVAILFTFAPQLMGVIRIGEITTTIPVFNLVVLEKVLPLFLICFGLGILREIIKLIEGRYTTRVAVATISLDLISLILTIIIFSRHEIWNPNFVAQITSLYGFGADISIQSIWNNFTTFFVGVFALAFFIDSIDTLYRSYRYGVSK